jgi:hypothetical protein
MHAQLSHRPHFARAVAALSGTVAAIALLSSAAHAGSVVILGDSLSVTKDIGLGNRLDLELRKAGHNVAA